MRRVSIPAAVGVCYLLGSLLPALPSCGGGGGSGNAQVDVDAALHVGDSQDQNLEPYDVNPNATGDNNNEVAVEVSAEVDAKADQSHLPPPPDGLSWRLTFSDEFDGTQINTEFWNIGGGTEAEPHPRRQGYWVKEAMSLDGAGNLVMATYMKEGKYFSGVIDTQGIFAQAFGYYEARMKASTQPGHWGAFWLMPDSLGAVDNGGIDGTEIDIMERPWTAGQMTWTNHALHWDAYADGADASRISEIPGIEEGYHTYGLWWTPDLYRFYVDGVEVWTTDAGGVCQTPLYLIFSDEVQSHAFFLSGAIEDATLPDRTLVDWVRVYSLE